MNIFFLKMWNAKCLIFSVVWLKKKYGSKITEKYCLLYTILLWFAKSWIIYFLHKSVFFFNCFVQIIGCLEFYLMYEMFVEAWRVYYNKKILIYVLVKITNELNWILIIFFFRMNKQTNQMINTLNINIKNKLYLFI